MHHMGMAIVIPLHFYRIITLLYLSLHEFDIDVVYFRMDE